MSFGDIPQELYDIFLNWGADFQWTNNSPRDLLMATGSELSQQRILRRLLTNALDYIWVPSFGAGLPQQIGQLNSDTNFDSIKSTITSQIFNESSVAQTPPPEVFLQNIQYNDLFCQINYTLSPSQQPIVLTFDVGSI